MDSKDIAANYVFDVANKKISNLENRIADLERTLERMIDAARDVLYYQTPTDDSLNRLQDVANEADKELKVAT